MSTSTRIIFVFSAALIVLGAVALDSHAQGVRDGLGLRAGFSLGPDQFVIGGQGEFGPAIGMAYVVPSFDLGLNGRTTTAANFDLRWYLLPVPETGLYIYGAAGPTVMLSPGTEVGLSLTAGLHIPMKNQGRYNMEIRFGLGDIPDLKIMGALMFGL